jgi:hypothetical protein
VKRSHLIGHMLVPVLIALGGMFNGLRREAISVEALLAYLVGGVLFYSAPHLLWAAVTAAVRPALTVWHAGFVGSTIALVLVTAMSLFGRHDSSGLPYQWLLYWPLAGIALLLVFAVWCSTGRPRASA